MSIFVFFFYCCVSLEIIVVCLLAESKNDNMDDIKHPIDQHAIPPPRPRISEEREKSGPHLISNNRRLINWARLAHALQSPAARGFYHGGGARTFALTPLVVSPLVRRNAPATLISLGSAQPFFATGPAFGDHGGQRCGRPSRPNKQADARTYKDAESLLPTIQYEMADDFFSNQ